MTIDISGVGIGGSVVLAAAAYAAVSVLVTGQVVGERTIEKSSWDSACRANIVASIEREREPPKIIPPTDCRSLMGAFLPELGRLCDQYGNPDFSMGARQALQEQERVRREAEERRIAEAARNSGSQCSCAAAVFVEEQRIPLALYAGSARLITPAPIKNMTSELSAALNAPQCAAKS